MSKLLKSDWSRGATTVGASAAPPGVASTMLALGATRWVALGLRVAAVGILSAGATALDAYNAPERATAAPAAIVATATVTESTEVAPPVAPRQESARAEAPAVEQITPPPALQRTAARSASPSSRADQRRNSASEASAELPRQGRNEVIELIRRGYCSGPCRGSTDANDAPR